MRPPEDFADRLQPRAFSPGNHDAVVPSHRLGEERLAEEEYQVLSPPHGEKPREGSGRSGLTESSCWEGRAGAPPPAGGCPV